MMKLIGEEINKKIYNILKKKNPILAELIIDWKKIVGEKFSKNSIPTKIIRSKESGKYINILYINTENSSVAMEISYQKEIILERISVYMGYKSVDKIIITNN